MKAEEFEDGEGFIAQAVSFAFEGVDRAVEALEFADGDEVFTEVEDAGGVGLLAAGHGDHLADATLASPATPGLQVSSHQGPTGPAPGGVVGDGERLMESQGFGKFLPALLGNVRGTGQE